MLFLQVLWSTLALLNFGYTFYVPESLAASERSGAQTSDTSTNGSESSLTSNGQLQLIDVRWGENIRPTDTYLSLIESIAWVTQFGYLSDTGGMDIPFGSLDLGDYGLRLKITSLNGRSDLKYLVIGSTFLQVARLMTETRNFRTIQANVASGRRLCARLELRTVHSQTGSFSTLVSRSRHHDLQDKTASWVQRSSSIAEITHKKFQGLTQASPLLLPLNSSIDMSQPSTFTNDIYIRCRAQYLANARTLLSRDIFLGIMQNIVNTMPTDPSSRVPPFQFLPADYNMALKFTSVGPDPRHDPLINMGMIVSMQRVMAKTVVKERRFAEMKATVYELNSDRVLGYGELTRQR